MADRTRHFSVFFAAAGVKTETVWRPAVDIYRTRTGGWLLKFELAGVKLEDLEILVQGCQIIVQGIRRDFVHEEGCTHYAMEIAYNRFQRSVELPCDIDSARWSVDYNDGILLVRLENH